LTDAARSQHPQDEVTFVMSASERDALDRIASRMGLTPTEALRKALSAELVLHGLRAQGAVIEFRMPDETGGEIA
jgi:hypothetical protein